MPGGEGGVWVDPWRTLARHSGNDRDRETAWNFFDTVAALEEQLRSSLHATQLYVFQDETRKTRERWVGFKVIMGRKRTVFSSVRSSFSPNLLMSSSRSESL
eukprot:Lithocolla_globosa_v1_NODE_7657_length_917_cov_27.744780.p2 type:complete len:102 gc:universal NODE_7657_length_917_cov_27.744780:449-144(-)